jgi:hypothetical protein
MAFWFRDVISESPLINLKLNSIYKSKFNSAPFLVAFVEPSSSLNSDHMQNITVLNELDIKTIPNLGELDIETIFNLGELDIETIFNLSELYLVAPRLDWNMGFLTLGLILALILYMRPHNFGVYGPLPNGQELKDSDDANGDDLLYKLIRMKLQGTYKTIYSRAWALDTRLNSLERMRLSAAGNNAETAGTLRQYGMKMRHSQVTYELSGGRVRSSLALICIVYIYSPR